MAFKLPNQADLTIEQTEIMNLPTNKNFVIQGGPGTGKTVMTVFRAVHIASRIPNANILVLVYNKPLCDFISTGLHHVHFNHPEIEIQTLDSWTGSFWKKFDLGNPPQNNGQKNWQQVGAILQNFHHHFYNHIIVDEAQDCHPEFLKGLASISDHITCFADPNQKVFQNAQCSNIVDMLVGTCEPAKYPTGAPITLTTNFRNTRQIAAVSSLFRPDDFNVSVQPAADQTGDRPILEKVANWDEELDKIVTLSKNFLDQEVGIIVNYDKVSWIAKELAEKLPPGTVQKHKTGAFGPGTKINWNLPGVKVVSYGTAKGLEFDLVIIPDLDYVNDSELQKALGDAMAADNPDKAFKALQEGKKVCSNRLFVAMSRPLRKLVAFYRKDFSSMHLKHQAILQPIFDPANAAKIDWR